MGRKSISVCMATYNGSKYVKEQLDSILNQLDAYDEVIISDDGSTDNTMEIIKSFNDERIRLYSNCFHNLNLNFEFTLKQASGEYIFLSDQDDVWLPGKVEEMLVALENHSLACSDCFVVNSNLDIISSSLYRTTKKIKTGFWNNFVICNYIGCCMAFRRSLLDKALPFPKGLICHDVWLGLVAEAFGTPVFINKQLIKYRRHSNNASQTTIGSTLPLKEKIAYRLLMLWGIMKIKFHI